VTESDTASVHAAPVRKQRQLELVLEPKVGWGGHRAGAGRKPKARPPVPHEPRVDFGRLQPYLVTLRVREDVSSLRALRVVRAVERALPRGNERGDFRLVHYALLANHVHLIVEADGPEALGRGMKSLGARFARGVNRALRRTGPVLARRYHHRPLSRPRETRNAIAYVLLNGRRHLGARAPARGRVDPASSGRFFDGWLRAGEAVEAPGKPYPVAAPRSWLLAEGWRRHGLIDPDEVPGPAGRPLARR
jgi:hypothetical protein